jgi:hypothetical protein
MVLSRFRRWEPAKSTLRHAFFKTVEGVGEPGVWGEALNQSAEIREFWCSNSAWSGVMAVTVRLRWNVDCRVMQLVVEGMKIELSGCVHCLHLKCDQEQPNKARRNPSVGFCTRGRSHIQVSAHRLGLVGEFVRKLAETQYKLIARHFLSPFSKNYGSYRV